MADHFRVVVKVVFVLDFADDLLDQVLDGDQTVNAAEFIDHQSHMRAFGPHFQQQLQHLHERGDEQNLALDLGKGKVPVPSAPGQNVLDMDHARRIVEGFAVNRQPGVAFLGQQVDQLRQ